MAAKDKFHETVKKALIKENYRITHYPLNLKFGKYDQILIDLGTEKDGDKIAVEIKSFLNHSAIFDFDVALGQFLNYPSSFRRKRVTANVIFSSAYLYLCL